MNMTSRNAETLCSSLEAGVSVVSKALARVVVRRINAREFEYPAATKNDAFLVPAYPLVD